MRVKTSVTIDARVLNAIDKAATRNRSRSRLIEDAAREFLARRSRAPSEARDLAILNEFARELNREMEDVLAYIPASYSSPAFPERRPSPIRTKGAQ